MAIAVFEWDEARRWGNIRKPGVDFADLEPLFEGETLTIPDDRFGYGEERFVTLGLLDGIVLVVVHLESGAKIRIISARKAGKNEEKRHVEEIADGLETAAGDDGRGD